VLTVPIFFSIDTLWLGVIAKGFYRRQLDFILSPQVNWTAAVVFYLMYIAGILFFIFQNAFQKDCLPEQVKSGYQAGGISFLSLFAQILTC
jgi:uncharacterized membrane protein